MTFGEEKLYLEIKKNQCMSRNVIGRFVANNPDCVGALDKLLKKGLVVMEHKDLFCVVEK